MPIEAIDKEIWESEMEKKRENGTAEKGVGMKRVREKKRGNKKQHND